MRHTKQDANQNNRSEMDVYFLRITLVGRKI